MGKGHAVVRRAVQSASNRAQQVRFFDRDETATVCWSVATTEIQSFELNAALLSRARCWLVHSLEPRRVEKLFRPCREGRRQETAAPRAEGPPRAVLVRMATGEGRDALTRSEKRYGAPRAAAETFNAAPMQEHPAAPQGARRARQNRPMGITT